MSRLLFRLKHALLIFWHRTILREHYITYRVRFFAQSEGATIRMREIKADESIN